MRLLLSHWDVTLMKPVTLDTPFETPGLVACEWNQRLSVGLVFPSRCKSLAKCEPGSRGSGTAWPLILLLCPKLVILHYCYSISYSKFPLRRGSVDQRRSQSYRRYRCDISHTGPSSEIGIMLTWSNCCKLHKSQHLTGCQVFETLISHYITSTEAQFEKSVTQETPWHWPVAASATD